MAIQHMAWPLPPLPTVTPRGCSLQTSNPQGTPAPSHTLDTSAAASLWSACAPDKAAQGATAPEEMPGPGPDWRAGASGGHPRRGTSHGLLPSTQAGRALVVPAICPFLHAQRAVCRAIVLRGWLLSRSNVTISHVPAAS